MDKHLSTLRSIFTSDEVETRYHGDTYRITSYNGSFTGREMESLRNMGYIIDGVVVINDELRLIVKPNDS